ncbi:MAG: MBL fold metallo-hydrolase, partial [Deltaproteobacteria bacterium]|nr:MBL fold metallo-hydrolase [Deltaproteobacteria bacterium]
RFRDGVVRNVASWHDEMNGRERGPNSIFVVESGGLRFVHLGDLGHELTPAQVKEIGPVDVLFVPVGGTFTLDERKARQVVRQLSPRRLVVPMHYATPTLKAKLPLAPLAGFLRGWRNPVRRVEGSTLTLESKPSSKGMDVVVFAFP